MIDPDMLRSSPTISPSSRAPGNRDHKLAGAPSISARPSSWAKSVRPHENRSGRKTKTGAWSTDSDVLEDVAAQGHPMAKKVLEWRGLAKCAALHRRASHLHQCQDRPGAYVLRHGLHSTGRLASTDPICRTFQSDRGRPPHPPSLHRPQRQQLDQRRLQPDRVCACWPYRRHSGMKRAFAENLDIQRHDASEIFGVRSRACPPMCAARQGDQFSASSTAFPASAGQPAGHPPKRGQRLHQKVFRPLPRHPRLYGKDKQFARTHGFVETLFGRRIHIREINSKIPGFRGGAERAAITLPSREPPPMSSAAPCQAAGCAGGGEDQGHHAAAGA